MIYADICSGISAPDFNKNNEEKSGMKVNTNSWHYKAAEFCTGIYNPSNNLCAYFWQVVAGIFLAFATGFVLLLTLFLLSTPVLMHFLDWMAFPGILTSFVLVAILGFELCNRLENQEETSQFHSVVKKFVSAKKNKICPRLEFVEKVK